MRVHFIIHEAYEGPGALLTWIKNQNYVMSSTNIYLNELLPSSIEFIDLLVVLGGPQCPDTTEQECHYFKVDREVAFIRDCIESRKAVLGVCLGAQLIGEALGTKFEKSPHKEVGYFPIALTKFARKHSKFAHFNSVELVGHWHNDMPGLTATSKVLARSQGCPRQIVEYSNLVYGFQCHLEFIPTSLTELVKMSADEFDDIDDHHYIQKPEDIIYRCTSHMNALLFEFMDKLMIEYTTA